MVEVPGWKRSDACAIRHTCPDLGTHMHSCLHMQPHRCTCICTNGHMCNDAHHMCKQARAHPHGLQWGPGQRPNPSTTLSRPCPLPPSGSGRCFPEQWGCRLPPSPALWHHLHQGQAAEPGQNRATCFARGHREPQACARLAGGGGLIPGEGQGGPDLEPPSTATRGQPGPSSSAH